MGFWSQTKNPMPMLSRSPQENTLYTCGIFINEDNKTLVSTANRTIRMHLLFSTNASAVLQHLKKTDLQLQEPNTEKRIVYIVHCRYCSCLYNLNVLFTYFSLPFIDLCVHSTHPSMDPSIHPAIHPSIHPSIHSKVHTLLVYPPINLLDDSC